MTVTDTTPLLAHDATALAGLIASGEASAVDAVEHSIERLTAADASLNFLVHEQFDQALAAAERVRPGAPFAGVPIVLKDLGGVERDQPYWCGSRYMERFDVRPPASDSVTEIFLRSGFIVLGRSATPEFGLDASTEPASRGPARNPWDPSRSTGGSSGGAAVAVATGGVPVAHANDAGGSIRIPSSFCGLVGLKPTRGRVSMGPGAGDEWGGLSTEGALTRTVRDAAAILELLSAPQPGDPHVAPPPRRRLTDAAAGLQGRRLRIGFVSQSPDGIVEPDVVAAVERTARLLESLGHRVVESHPGNLFDPLAPQAMAGVISAGVAHLIDELTQQYGEPPRADDLEAGTWIAVEEGRAQDAVHFQRCLAHYNVFSRTFASWWGDDHDLLLTPTHPRVAPALRPEGASTTSIGEVVEALPFTIAANVAGMPAISLPLGRSADGVPIGVQLIGRFGREDELIEIAADLESAAPWADTAPGWGR
jgi:amidase